MPLEKTKQFKCVDKSDTHNILPLFNNVTEFQQSENSKISNRCDNKELVNKSKQMFENSIYRSFLEIDIQASEINAQHKISPRGICKYYVNWLQNKIEHFKLAINDGNTKLHIVRQQLGMLLCDSQKTKPIKVILESLIVGASSLCLTSIIDVLGLLQSASMAIVAAMRFMVITALRDSLLKIINQELGV